MLGRELPLPVFFFFEYLRGSLLKKL